MVQVDLENGEWDAVKVGPETLGWMGPNKPLVGVKRTTYADLAVLMGDGQFEVSPLEMAQIAYKSESPESVTTAMMLKYNRKFAVHVPTGSLDISDTGEIVYSERSKDALYTASTKLFCAVMDRIQSELNAEETPVGVVRKCAELMLHGYSTYFFIRLSWRGTQLNELLRDSEMLVCVTSKDDVIPLVSTSDRYRYMGFGKIRNLHASTPFSSFVDWQMRTHFDNGNTVPSNVFLIRASSTEELKQGTYICKSDSLLKKFLAVTGRANISDATFFLTPVGDPLEEWIDGEVLSVKELAGLIELDLRELAQP